MNALLRPFWVCAIIIMSTAETLPQKKLIFDYYSDGGGGTFTEKTEPISSTNKFMMDDISIVTEILNSYFGYNAVTLENAEYFVEASSIIVIDTKDQSNNNNTATMQSLSYPDQCFLNNDNDYYYDNTMTKNIAADNNNNITLFDNNNMTITATSLRKEFCVMSSQNRGTCECIPGFFFYDDKEGCIACPQGKFKAVYGNDALCIACPDGSRSTRGQRRCWPCPPNTYSSACIPCPEYTEAPDEGSAVCRCIAGTALDFFGERCVPCRPGQYSKPSNNNKTNECVLCDGLTTTSVAGATVCDECVAGTSKTIRKNIIITNTTPTPNDKCEACPSGTFFSEKKECVACSSGSYTDAPMQTACASCHTASSSYYQPEVGQTSCLTCTFPAGSMGQKNGSGCVCPPGTELDYSGQACAPCQPGFFSREGEGCSMCPGYTTSAGWGASTCDGCAAGYSGVVCQPCAAGFYENEGICLACPPATFSSMQGATACDKCPLLVKDASTKCDDVCPNGMALDTIVDINACHCIAGTALDFSGEHCVPCRPGQYQPSAGPCLLCDGLTTNTAIGATVCDECVTGAVAKPNGKTNIMMMTTTGNITSSTTTTTPTPNDKCEACPSGTFFSEKKECVACSSGSYTDAPMQTACASCHTASSSYYQPEVGQTSCLTCTFPAGSMGQKNGSGCVCPPGTELDYSGQACAPCQPGFFSREGEGCSMCPGYTTSAGWGASTCDGCAAGYSGVVCQPCAAGFYENEGICLACPPATFSSMQGATACDKCLFYLVKAAGATQCRSSCPIGSFVNNDDGCIFCAAGKYQKNLTEECVECDSGTYAPSEGLTACLICPRYTTTSNGGNKMACACAPGTIIDYTERQCVPCPPGSMCGDEHDTLCAIGTYNPFEAATACLPCAAARFEGATICPSSNNTIIITCPDNFFFMQENNSCVACSTRCLEENYYISKECGDTEDIVCAPNVTCSQPNEFKTPNERCQRCRSTCPAGFFIATPCSPNADTVCMPCTTACPSPAFFVSSACNDGVNDLRCEECSVPGTFTDDLGTCRACDPGSIFMLNEGCLRCPTDTPLSNANRTACVQRCPAGNLHYLFFYLVIYYYYYYDKNDDDDGRVVCRIGCGMSDVSTGVH